MLVPGRLGDRAAVHCADRISRYDIADYLALSVETVSRALTSLKRSGLIKFAGTRQIAIIDRDVIETSGAFGQIGAGPRVEPGRMPGSDTRIFASVSFSARAGRDAIQ